MFETPSFLPPRYDESTTDSANFREVWEQSGTLKVEAFLPPLQLNQLQTAVHASYNLLRQHINDDPPTLNVHLADHFTRRDALWMKELLEFLKNFEPNVCSLFYEVMIAVEVIFQSLFDTSWRLNTGFTFVRRCRSTADYLPWHIDADAASIINAAEYCINAWVPLDAVGNDAPSLDLVPGSNKTMRNLPLLPTAIASRTDDWIKDNFPGEAWTPRAVPGDAILFDHWTLHRTQRISRPNVLRTSCEFRFVQTA